MNKHLLSLLESKEEAQQEGWIDETIQSVILNEGSVQHLECLTPREREVFKTAFELDQMWIVEHAVNSSRMDMPRTVS